MTDQQSQVDGRWRFNGHRDEAARLLVRAIVKNRDALLADHADVPIQSYRVHKAEYGVSGGLSIGALISLWERTHSMITDCRPCGLGQARAFWLGGMTDCHVAAVCPECGSIGRRLFYPSDVRNSLRVVAEDTPYSVPNLGQLNSMDGFPRPALVTALRAVGVRVLPSEFSAMISPCARNQEDYLSPIDALIRRWSYDSETYSLQSGEEVDKSDRTWNRLHIFVERFLERTGRLPELEQNLDEEIGAAFPMYRDESVVSAL